MSRLSSKAANKNPLAAICHVLLLGVSMWTGVAVAGGTDVSVGDGLAVGGGVRVAVAVAKGVGLGLGRGEGVALAVAVAKGVMVEVGGGRRPGNVGRKVGVISVVDGDVSELLSAVGVGASGSLSGAGVAWATLGTLAPAAASSTSK